MHSCGNNEIGCAQNEKSGKLIIFIKSNYFEANYCPFCGYQPERSKREDYLEYSEHEIANFIRDYLLMKAKLPIRCNLEKLTKIVLDELNRCGALNSMET